MPSDLLHPQTSRCYKRPVSRDGTLLDGTPLQVVTVNFDNGKANFFLDIEKLEQILLHPEVRSRHVVVVSVAGAFRQGKSFLLDFLLRYMDAKGDPDWLGDKNAPLEGFSWRGGSERDTTGILMWSEPYVRTLPDGDEVAVLLMDTQGAFDSQSTVRDCATVFALSTMLSSVQVYNISSNVQEDHLQHLHLFTDYGLLALEKGVSTPFQHLHFLVRDWSYPYEYDYGAAGGDKLIAKRLQPDPSQPQELQNVRQHLWSCFQEIHAFLMPHPGLNVASNPHFDGRISDIEPKFLQCIQQFAPLLLHEKNLVVKQINDQKICGRDLLHYFKSYMEIYKGDSIPEPKTVWEATAEANNLAAVASAKDFYCKEMDQVCGCDRAFVECDVVERADERVRGEAVLQFQTSRKMGGETFSKPYLEQLQAQLILLGEQYKSNNQSKSLFGNSRPLGVLLLTALADYFLWGIFNALGVTPAVLLCQFLFLALIFSVFMWAYARYTGQYRAVAENIDKIANAMFTQVYQPLTERVTGVPINALIPPPRPQSPTNSTVPTGSSSNAQQRKKQD